MLCILNSPIYFSTTFNTVSFQSIEIPKKVFGGFGNILHVYLLRDSKNKKEIEFSRLLFEGRLTQCKNVLPDGLHWLCYFASSSKSHRENSISFIFLESSHQVDMKNVVKSSKHFFGYFNTLETHSGNILFDSTQMLKTEK